MFSQKYVLPTVEAKQIFAQITSLYLAYGRQTFAIILRERHFSWKRINITDINYYNYNRKIASANVCMKFILAVFLNINSGISYTREALWALSLLIWPQPQVQYWSPPPQFVGPLMCLYPQPLMCQLEMHNTQSVCGVVGDILLILAN